MTRRTLSVAIRLVLFVGLGLPAGAAAGPLRFPEDDAVRRAEQMTARKDVYRRQIQSRIDRERADLLAFGTGASGERVRAAVRKNLRILASASDAAEILSEPVPSVPASDVVPNDRLLALVSHDGRLPRAPLSAIPVAAAERWQPRIDAAWSECLDAVRRGASPPGELVACLKRDVRIWKDTTSAPEDRARRLAAQGHFRDLELLVQSLSDARRATRLRHRLLGFSGGTLVELASWMLANDLVLRTGTPTQKQISRLAFELVREFDRSHGTGGATGPSLAEILAQPASGPATIDEPSATIAAPSIAIPESPIESRDTGLEQGEEVVVPRKAAPQSLLPEPSVGW